MLVIGANGQLSKEFQKIHSDKLTCLSSKDLDLRNLDEIYPNLKKYNPDLIINFSAYNFVDLAESDPDNFVINAQAIKKIAEYSKDADIELIHISTDYVFDGKKGNYIESDLMNPINAYGKAKLAGENYIREICSKYFIVRTSWLYSVYENNFLDKIVSSYKSEINLKGADDIIGSPTSARSLANAIYHLIQSKSSAYGLYHFSNIGEISKYVFIQSIVDKLASQNQGSNVQVAKAKNKDFKLPANRPYNTSLNSSKFERTFNFKIPLWEKELHSIMSKL